MQGSFRALGRRHGPRPAPGAPAGSVRWVRGPAEPTAARGGGAPGAQGTMFLAWYCRKLQIPRQTSRGAGGYV